MELADGSKISSSNYTKAIKQTNQYAGLFAARAPDLSLDEYKFEPKQRSFLSLIEFEASNNTLYYMVFVCGEYPIFIDSSIDFGIKYFKFTHFHLAVV
jgi:hypothetical protein